MITSLCSVTTRPDKAFAASRIARFLTDPNEEYHDAAERVLSLLSVRHKMAGIATT